VVNALFWNGRKVLLTGHTGFKGGWFSLWLQRLGADVCGIALEPSTTPNLFQEASVGNHIRSEIADIRDASRMKEIVRDTDPEILFHLAAQPLVRQSYDDPLETYSTNVMGTANVLDAARSAKNLRAIVVITTDKCYENREWIWPYRETDTLGGYDPYSNSKACAELVVSSYRNSFFAPAKYSEHGVAVATARAGNVIGGGDWSKDRLVPDIMRTFAANQTLTIRNPKAVRPWQHVLEPLAGYLKLGKRLLTDGIEYGDAWNFGPEDSDARPVEWIVQHLAAEWGLDASWQIDKGPHPHEAQMLKLDWSKAANFLSWRPALSLTEALRYTADWYRQSNQGDDMHRFTLHQIEQYEQVTNKYSSAAAPISNS
jgi:CDP-glucose 4,6-dehydratase